MNSALPSLFTYAQLAATGLTEKDIRSRVASGQLVRIRRGVYGTPGELDAGGQHLRLVRATTPALHPESVLSHQSAACLHGLPVPGAWLSSVAATSRTGSHGGTRRNLSIHATPLGDDEVTTVGDLTVTTLVRTVTDLARTLPFPWAVAVCDAALGREVERDALSLELERHPRLFGLPAARRAVQFADGRSQSPAESISRVQFARYGLPAPELQFAVTATDGRRLAVTDFCWPELRLVGEVDGKWKYGELLKPGRKPEDAIMAEKVREEGIRGEGYWITRWGWALANDGPGLAQQVLRAMDFQRKHLGL